VKSSKLAFAKMLVFILFFDFYFGKKKVNLGNNPKMGYDIYMAYLFLPRGRLCNCIVQLKSKNIKTPLSSNVSFLYSRGI
jgi:hypothetical protein